MKDKVQQCCGNCGHNKYNREYKDFMCMNKESGNIYDFVDYNDYCAEWESREQCKRVK